MPELVFFRRGEEVLRVALERQRLVLGRAQECDIVIPDPHVSRQHLALLLDGTRCLLEDLSGQGTVVAGQPMQRGELPTAGRPIRPKLARLCQCSSVALVRLHLAAARGVHGREVGVCHHHLVSKLVQASRHSLALGGRRLEDAAWGLRPNNSANRPGSVRIRCSRTTSPLQPRCTLASHSCARRCR